MVDSKPKVTLDKGWKDRNKAPVTETATVETPPAGTPSMEVSEAAKKDAADVPGGQTTSRRGLTGVPLGTKVFKSMRTATSPEEVVAGENRNYGVTQYATGDGQKIFATKNNKEKLQLLLRLSKIPGLYKEGQAYTEEQIRGFARGNLVPIRTEDTEALEKVLYLADTTGDDYETTLVSVETNPALAISAFGTTKAKKIRLTPAAALALELEQSVMDYLDQKVSKEDKASYAKRVNEAERKRGGSLTELERREILNDTIQDKARKVFKDAGEDASELMRRGALGETYNTLRQTYADYGVMADDKAIYKQAIQSIRSKQALDNIINKVKLQAEVSMPALKTYIQQGLTPREALGSYITYYSKAMGVPESQVDLMKLNPVVSGDKILPFQDWQRFVQKMPEFKSGPLYRQQQFNDAQILARNFLGQERDATESKESSRD